jgi:hypothetical protein
MPEDPNVFLSNILDIFRECDNVHWTDCIASSYTKLITCNICGMAKMTIPKEDSHPVMILQRNTYDPSPNKKLVTIPELIARNLAASNEMAELDCQSFHCAGNRHPHTLQTKGTFHSPKDLILQLNPLNSGFHTGGVAVLDERIWQLDIQYSFRFQDDYYELQGIIFRRGINPLNSHYIWAHRTAFNEIHVHDDSETTPGYQHINLQEVFRHKNGDYYPYTLVYSKNVCLRE